MFSKITYLLQQGSPSPHLNGNEILPYHHHDMLSGHYLGANAPVNVDAAAFFDRDVAGLNGDPYAIVDTCPRSAKKDRHSKIYTAQGPRDRRVRLSIGVSRKFFDLQEMLGFDKPSKTLDWLLTKSKTAIKDLVQMKEKASTTAGVKTVSSDPSECEVDSAEAFEIGKSLGTDSKRKLVMMNADKHKEEKDSKKVLNLAKESRVKARARARERTREKMCIKQLNIETRNNGYDLNPSIPTQYMNNQLEVSKISGSSSNNSSSMKANAGIREAMLHCHPTYEAANEDLIQESIVIKREVNHPSILGFQQNLIISQNLSSNYGVLSPYNAPDHWDFNSFTSQSNICAIFEQHKFIN